MALPIKGKSTSRLRPSFRQTMAKEYTFATH
jgi:hypothetical protein